MTTTRYRPQFVWLVMSPLLGAFSGAVVAAVIMWGVMLFASTSSSTGLGDIGAGLAIGLFVGGIVGGICGGAVGLVVGVPMTFLVGRHLPRDVARRRAYVLGAVLPPITLFIGYAVLFDTDPTAADPSLLGGDDLVALVPLVGSALLGSRLSAWLAGKGDEPATPLFQGGVRG